MGAGILTAFGREFPSLSGQRAGPARRQTATLLCILFLATLLPGCASVHVMMLSSESFTTQSSQLEILDQPPTRAYVPIAVLSLDSWWLNADSRREKIAEKAATLGADAVIFGEMPLLAPRRAAPSVPSPSLPSQDTQEVLPDGLHPSMQDGTLDTDIRVYLVRGGGHGGGRGGGHGHGGHWGGRSGHSGSRHWRHGPGPAYWGYGFYGPGWWGYGPNWSPYWEGYYSPSPYAGSYPHAWYGEYTATVGTAIHYTD